MITEAGRGNDNSEPHESPPIYFPSSDTFEAEDEAELPPASMAVSEPHHSERGTVAAITSARKTKYSSQKKRGKKISEPSLAVPQRNKPLL